MSQRTRLTQNRRTWTIFMSRMNCGSRSSRYCQQCPKGKGQGVQGLTTGRFGTASGMCCGQAASGKQSIDSGSGCAAVSCTNVSKPGSRWASSSGSCRRWFASMLDSGRSNGSGSRWTANRALHRWEGRKQAKARWIAAKAAAKSTCWSTSEVRRWRCTSPARMSMINGRQMT